MLHIKYQHVYILCPSFPWHSASVSPGGSAVPGVRPLGSVTEPLFRTAEMKVSIGCRDTGSVFVQLLSQLDNQERIHVHALIWVSWKVWWRRKEPGIAFI